MLVLTRRHDQSIVFPELDITIQILRVRGNVVKVGIQAPDDVTILRKEVMDDGGANVPPSRREQLRHDIRNLVHTAMLSLTLLAKRVEKGLVDDFDAEFKAVAADLRAISKLVAPPETNERLEPTNGAAQSTRRALLVEDDANQSQLLSGYLRLSGFDVTVAPDGYAALDQLESGERPDVVLLDMRMPGLDGAETLRRIRRNPELTQLKVFAISGTAPWDFGVPEGPRGVDRWFPKPLDPETLVTTLQDELHHVSI
jgi:carbon storage regulator CsrA